MNDEQLDGLLKQVPDPEPSAQLMRAVAEIPLRHPRAGALGWRELVPFRSLWQATASAVAVLALGLAVGAFTASPAAADDEDWDDMAALTFGDDFVSADTEDTP